MSENKEIKPGRVESFDEIVFEHRNKEYGAYYLRKRYNIYVFFAFWIATAVVSSAVLTPLIASYYNRDRYLKKMDKTVTVVMEKVNEEEAPPPPPPPPPPPEAIQQAKFTAPVVVDTVKDDVKIATVDDIKQNVAEAAPVDLVITEKKTDVVPEEEPAFLVVEESATFQGGDINSFYTWVKQNVVYPTIASENNIQGKVIVQFAVNSHGEISDVKVLRGADRALDEEAVRVIKSSPKWTPGRQGGKSVKQQFMLPIVFQLQTN